MLSLFGVSVSVFCFVFVAADCVTAIAVVVALVVSVVVAVVLLPLLLLMLLLLSQLKVRLLSVLVLQSQLRSLSLLLLFFFLLLLLLPLQCYFPTRCSKLLSHVTTTCYSTKTQAIRNKIAGEMTMDNKNKQQQSFFLSIFAMILFGRRWLSYKATLYIELVSNSSKATAT